MPLIISDKWISWEKGSEWIIVLTTPITRRAENRINSVKDVLVQLHLPHANNFSLSHTNRLFSKFLLFNLILITLLFGFLGDVDDVRA